MRGFSEDFGFRNKNTGKKQVGEEKRYISQRMPRGNHKGAAPKKGEK